MEKKWLRLPQCRHEFFIRNNTFKTQNLKIGFLSNLFMRMKTYCRHSGIGN